MGGHDFICLQNSGRDRKKVKKTLLPFMTVSSHTCHSHQAAKFSDYFGSRTQEGQLVAKQHGRPQVVEKVKAAEVARLRVLGQEAVNRDQPR